jgi:membrane associated rhomboid family serine protease
MGFQDREYYQEEHGSSGFQFGSDLSYTIRLVIANAAVFLLDFFLQGQQFLGFNGLQDALSMHGDTLVKPWLWYQFITYGFAHGGLDHLFWNMIGLIVFGNEIERTYGKREFLRFYLVAMVFGGLLWGVRVYGSYALGWNFIDYRPQDLHLVTMLGASGAVMATTILFCLRYPFSTLYVMMLLPVPAWLVGTIYVVIDLFQAGHSQGTVANDVHLAGAAFAVAYFLRDWRLARMLSFGWLTRMGTTLKRLATSRPKLKVYDDEPDDSIYRELEIEADRILEKIAKEGENSLSHKERQTLEHYSRLMRQKHR